MRIPFTIEQFLDVFRRYHAGVWPAEWVLLVSGVTAVVLALRAGRRTARAIAAILAVLWLWMGLVYHLVYFRAINPAAVGFAVLFVAQGALLAWLGVWRGRLAFRVRGDAAGVVGGALVVYALVVYPALGLALGHRYPAAPTFGLPCPTTIFTLGLLAWARPLPRVLLVVPVLWSVVATSAAAQLGMREDFGLPAAAVAAVAVTLRAVGARRHERAAAARP